MSRQTDPSLDLVVVIPSFNQRLLLADCLASVQADVALSGLRVQIVVVDNASWDDSAQMVAERFNQVTLLENEINQGFAAACNQGGKVYQSRYVLLLNNDATLLPGSLQAAVEFADSQAKVGALTGRLLAPNGHERYPASHFWQRWYPPRPHIHELSWVPGTCLLLRREALQQVGWLDEDFFFYNEDLDLSIRLKKAGWKLMYHPAVGVNHQESGSSQLIRPRAMMEGYRGTLLLCLKHYGKPVYAITRFALLLEVQARLAFLGLLRLLKPRHSGVEGRYEAYEAILSVLKRGVSPSVPDEIGAKSEG
ncbi:MAG: glycosyl transferase family 2 [Cyanobacteria bacterium RYN_339]|nr:glycosyl transferase family 2 [Cyanobacteria bacterium RYN_339]